MPLPAPHVASPFHAGEREVQARVGVRERMDKPGARAIRDFMPDQHREFFARLPFLAVATQTADPWPAATILAGPEGFVSSPDPHSLHVATQTRVRDLAPGAPIGILGIELATRRRNRANGRVARVEPAGFTVTVEQSFGNCAQYIQARETLPAAPASPAPPERLARLDAPARAAIEGADTLFVASASAFGADMSHRGGRPGFVRLDGDVLTIPDFAGNRYFNTLGNFALNPHAALLFPDFASGDVLHLRGDVEILWGGEEVLGFLGAQRLWRLRIAGAERHRQALPLRFSPPEYAPSTMQTGIWRTGTRSGRDRLELV